jgi:ABC-type lipoprotein export system ATPase subunit
MRITLDSMSSSCLIAVTGLIKTYRRGASATPVLRGIDFSVEHGEFVAVMGASGSGKTTLLHILGCLDSPTDGHYLLDGTDVTSLPDRALSRIRARHIGFVFQTFNLVPSLTVRENIALPFIYAAPGGDFEERVRQSMEWVGLSHRADHRPAALSGGEMQRVAIARALAVKPKLILADEPTGNLDLETTRDILALFVRMHADGATVVVVTHDQDVAACARRRVLLTDGVLA